MGNSVAPGQSLEPRVSFYSSWRKIIETTTILTYLLLVFIASLGPLIVFYTFFYTKYWFLALAYVTWIIYDRNIGKQGGRSLPFYRNLPIWKWYTSYFPIRLVKTAELDPSKNYLLGYHPHGLFVVGNQGNFITEANNISQLFPGIKNHFVTMNGFFHVPFFREIILMAGGCSVAEESLDFLLSKKGGGNGVLIVPGGAREVLEAKPGSNTLYLKKRKGFIRLAIKNGSSLVPVYSFGENDVFDTIDNPEGSRLRNLQETLRKWFGGFPIFAAPNSYAFGLLPMPRPITSVVGAPIEVTQMDSPTQEYVDEIHGKYVDALTALFYAHREKCGHPNAELTVK